MTPFENQLFGACRAVGVSATVFPDTGRLNAACPSCAAAVLVGESDVKCSECSFTAAGEPWEIANAMRPKAALQLLDAPRASKADIAIPLPSSIAAERCVIASLASGGASFDEVVDIITPADFSDSALRTGFEWMTDLFMRNQRVSLFTLHDGFSHLPAYAGFREAIQGVAVEHGTPVLEHAHALRERSHFRAIVAAVDQLKTAADSAKAYSDIREAVEGLLSDAVTDSRATGVRSARDIVESIRERLANPKHVPVYRTGFRNLDAMLKGGLKPKQLVVISGRTGGGKTVLGMNIAVQCALDGVPVAVFSLEMEAEELLVRCILSESRASEENSEERIARLPIHVSDNPDITSKGLWAMMKVLKARHNIGVFVVDYLQLIGDEPMNRESRERVVAGISRRLKIAAKQLGVTVVALCQVNEMGELRESRAIEQDSDAVLQVITNGDDFWLRVCKNRGGKNHGPIKAMDPKEPDKNGIAMDFNGEFFRFTEKFHYHPE